MTANAVPWLSVLVPVYNVEPYLRQCVESVLQRADDGVELLLLDDASTDGSAALMRALQAEHGPRLRLLAHEHNRGISAVRNRLLQAATGRYLWFIDGDDWIAPEAMLRLAALLRTESAPDVLLFDYRVARSRSALKHRLRGEAHRRGFVGPARTRLETVAAPLAGVLASGNVFCWTHVSRRSLWQDDLRFPEGRLFEDMTTVPRLMLRARSTWHEPQPWVVYRRRDDSLSAGMSARKVADLSASLRGMQCELLAHWPEAPQGLRFAVAHQAARNLLAAVRHAQRLAPGEATALLPRCGDDFLAASGDGLALLQQQYLRRGWWWRAWRLRRALRACGR